MASVSLVDASENKVAAKKSSTTSRAFVVTTVYHRAVTGDEEDYNDYKNYINDKIQEFYRDKFVDTLNAEDQRLLERKPVVTVDISLEKNQLGYLHHHAIVEVETLRIEKDNGKLARTMIDYKKFYGVFLPFMNLGLPVKVHIDNLPASSISNVKKYIMKKTE